MKRIQLIAVALAVCACAGASVTTAVPGWTFLETEAPTFVGTNVACAAKWTLEDWRGRTVREGEWPETGILALAPHPPGYYRVKYADAACGGTGTFSFCVVTTNRCRSAESFFAADSGLSGCSRRGSYDCPWYGGDCWHVTAELLGKCGIVHTRERLEWGPFIEPKKGKRDFSRYLASARAMKANGVMSTGIFHDVPPWLRQRGRGHAKDLMELYRFMEDAARTFDGYYDSWEYWNEQDLNATPVWEYMAALKAYALGARAGAPETIILPGALSGVVRQGYAQVMFDCDAAKYVQALNVHTYEPIAGYGAWHENLRKFMSEAGIEGWQIWLTESGTNLEGNGEQPSSRKGLLSHSDEHEMVMAEFFPKSAILHRHGGIFRNWFFLFGCYNEQSGCRDWGSMRRDGTVKPIHAAMSAATSAIGSARLLGEKDIGKGLRGFVFAQPDGTRTLAFWSVSNLELAAGPRVRIDSLRERKFTLAVPDGKYRLTDMMGTPSSVRAANGTLSLTATRYPQYLAGLGEMEADVPSANAGRLARYVPPPDEDLSVVVRPMLDTNDFTVSGGSCVAELGRAKGKMRLEVWNFSPAAKRGRLSASCGNLDCGAGDISLPPWGMAVVDAAYSPPPEGLSPVLDIAGVFEGKRITKMRIPVFNENLFMSRCETVPLKHLENPRAWRRNDSGSKYSCVYDEAEKAVRFDVEWSRSSGVWFFPIHDFSPGESFAGAKYMEFEVRNVQDKVENDMFCVEVKCHYGKGRSRGVPFKTPRSHWEKRRVLLPDNAGDMTGFSLGGLIRGHKLSYWVRNFRILKECVERVE